MEEAEALEATEKATTVIASYHASVDVERVDYVLVERLLAFLYSEGDFAGDQVLRLCLRIVYHQSCNQVMMNGLID
jgi:hypothetical protein